MNRISNTTAAISIASGLDDRHFGNVPAELRRSLLERLREQFERLRKARADADSTEVPPIDRQHSVNLASLGDSGHGTVDEPHIQILELGIEFKRANQVRGER